MKHVRERRQARNEIVALEHKANPRAQSTESNVSKAADTIAEDLD
jgi:hypothetical protein